MRPTTTTNQPAMFLVFSLAMQDPHRVVQTPLVAQLRAAHYGTGTGNKTVYMKGFIWCRQVSTIGI